MDKYYPSLFFPQKISASTTKYKRCFKKESKIFMLSELIYKYYEKCCFVYDKTHVKLSDEFSRDINKYWKELIDSGKKYENGEIFTVNDISVDRDGMLKFALNKTNYAHYLYSQKNNFEGDYVCRSIATNVLPITTDNKYVLGTMSNSTSLSNKIKFIGGSMSEDDFVQNRLETLKCAKREVMEEIGLDLNDKESVLSYEPIYFITRKNLSFINVLYLVHLNISSDQMRSNFENYKSHLIENDMEVELDSIELVENDLESNKAFITNNRNNLIDYMESVFNVIYRIEEPKNIISEIKTKNSKQK